MKLILADDHALVRDTLAAFIAAVDPAFEVIPASTVDDVLAALAAAGKVDLVLLDYRMPGMNGLHGLATVKARVPDTPVAIMSGQVSRAFAEEVLEAGAAGFLPKTMHAKSMVNAIRFMAMGERYVPVDIAEGALEPAASALAASLTERERQVLDGLCRGLANKEIARELDLQEVTVKLHVKTLCRKLDARNRTQAAMIAKEAGLV